jgi:hypothetical protein
MVLDSLAASRNCSRPSGFKSSLNSVHLIDPPCGNSTTRSKSWGNTRLLARTMQALFSGHFSPGRARTPLRAAAGSGGPDLLKPGSFCCGKAGRKRDCRKKAQEITKICDSMATPDPQDCSGGRRMATEITKTTKIFDRMTTP